MGEAAEREVSGDPEAMMRRLEQLERERAELDAKVEQLDREEQSIADEQRARADARAELERRRAELHDDEEIVARRDAIDDEHRKMIERRDALDAEYTELYGRLDAIADAAAVPAFVPPAVTDRVAGVELPPDPVQEPWFPAGPQRRVTLVPYEPAAQSAPSPLPRKPSDPPPAARMTLVPGGAPPPAQLPSASHPAIPIAPPSRTTLIVESSASPSVAITPPWWKQPRGMIAIAASAFALLVIVGLAARPDEPAPPQVDPAEALATLRAAIVPPRTESPAPAIASPTPDAKASTPAPAKRTPKKRTSKKSTPKKTATKKPAPKKKG
ncbi:MAG TPA: hypothetical protein VG755_06265 [Nannocystaceae bacterium]|nr:hypothetical protein [Nannocystaceae bacterium]